MTKGPVAFSGYLGTVFTVIIRTTDVGKEDSKWAKKAKGAVGEKIYDVDRSQRVCAAFNLSKSFFVNVFP